MNVEAYLQRIGVPQRPSADLEGLCTLHRAHLLSVPFENLDVQLGRPVTTELAPIYGKLVDRRRGGWCYEMNGLFGWALQQLGFRVTRTAAGVMRETSGDAALGNHLTLQVMLPEGLYLADVGFGDGPLEPVALKAHDFTDGRFPFALSQPEDSWWRFHNPQGGAKSFDFQLAPADEQLFAIKCAWLQTDNDSGFVQNLVCQRHTPEGLTVLRGRMLRRIKPEDIASERLIESGDDLVCTLRSEFDLDVPEAASLWPKITARHAALFGSA
jgi:N-hydroxyarylamine O-acetyltransferase